MTLPDQVCDENQGSVVEAPVHKNPWTALKSQHIADSFVHVEPNSDNINSRVSPDMDQSVWCVLSDDGPLDDGQDDKMDLSIISHGHCPNSDLQKEMMFEDRSASPAEEDGFVVYNGRESSNVGDLKTGDLDGEDWVMLPGVSDISALFGDVRTERDKKSPREPIILSDIWENVAKEQKHIEDMKLQRKIERRVRKKNRKGK